MQNATSHNSFSNKGLVSFIRREKDFPMKIYCDVILQAKLREIALINFNNRTLVILFEINL